MALFNVPDRRNGKSDIKEKLKKTSIRTSTGKVITVSGSMNGIISRMQTMSEVAKRELSSEGKKLIMEKNELISYLDEMAESGYGGIDTETSGLDPITDELAGICLYYPGGYGAYVPVGHINYMTGVKIEGQLEIEFVASEIEKRKSRIKWIFHNSKFDIRVMRWGVGIDIQPYWDTQIASHLLNENEAHGLKYLHAKYVLRDLEKSKNTYSKLFKDIDFRLVPLDVACLYAAGDSIMTYDLYTFQKQYLDPTSQKCIEKGLIEMSNLFHNIEMPLVPVIADMEDTGVSIDTEYADELSVKYHEALEFAKGKVYAEIAKIQSRIDDLPIDVKGALDDPINLSSPDQVAVILYDVLHLKSPNKKKPRGTGAEILEHFKSETPIAEAILGYRTIEKLLGTYIDKIPLEVKKKTGKLHAQFKQDKTVTGRFSSSDPNLQNIPSRNKDIRKMFVADKGCVFIGGDYSQQEPRVLAHMSGDEHMINSYLEGRDIYAAVASKVYQLPYEECLEFHPDTGAVQPEGKKRRNSMKPVILGIMYGRGEASIAEGLGVSIEEAKGIINDFDREFPKVAEFVEASQRNAREYGYVETAWGRKRRLPDIQLPTYEFKCKSGEIPESVKNKFLKKLRKAWNNEKKQIIEDAKKQGIYIKNNGGFIAQAERQCVNSIIQGTSADITKKALLMLGKDEALKELGFKSIMTVHDEIIGMCPLETAKEASGRMVEIMIEAAKEKISVPMSVDIEVTERWYGKLIEL